MALLAQLRFAVDMDADSRARSLAEGQHGHIHRDQLKACGLSAKQIHIRKARGDLIRVLPGVFRLGGVPDDLSGRLAATALWLRDDGFFNDQTALHIYGLDGIEAPKRIGVARQTGLNGPDWIKVSRIDAGDRPSIRRVKGFRVCSVERALAESCGNLPPRRAGKAIDDALRRRLTTLDRLKTFSDRWGKGKRGARLFRELVRARDARDEQVRSSFETKMLAILRRIKEHHFLPDHHVLHGKKSYYIDFYLPAAALGLECHSRRFHLGNHTEDARRDRYIRSLGIELLYFTWEDVCYHAEEVEREVRDAIERRISTFFSSGVPESGISLEKKAR
jgi:very-short-patch-repair endonuclease